MFRENSFEWLSNVRTPNAFRQCEVFLLLRPEIHNKRNHNRYLVWNQRDIFHISNGNETILRIEKKNCYRFGMLDFSFESNPPLRIKYLRFWVGLAFVNRTVPETWNRGKELTWISSIFNTLKDSLRTLELFFSFTYRKIFPFIDAIVSCGHWLFPRIFAKLMEYLWFIQIISFP